MSDNVLTFTRRPINEWPREVYLADFGDGDGCRPYAFIQHPDDTTPRYIRSDLHEAEVEKLKEEIERFRSERPYVIGWNDGFEHATKEPKS